MYENVRTPEERFSKLPGYPFEPNYAELSKPGGGTLRMHYVDEGPRDASPVLMAHGEPTWSYLYRKMVPVFVEAGLRAIAPDHIGFGRSDKLIFGPDYSFAQHLAWLREFVVGLDLRDITLVCQDWGGPIGLGVLAAEESRFARVVVANTILHTAGPEMKGKLNAENYSEDGLCCVSEQLLNWAVSSVRLREFDASTSVEFATTLDPPKPVLAAYDAPFPDERYKAGMRQFPVLIPVTPLDPGAEICRNTWQVLERFEKPFLTAYSDGDPATAGWEKVFQERVPGAKGQPHTVVRDAGHFLQEDQGQRFAEVVLDFIRTT